MQRGELWWAMLRMPSGSRKRRPMLIVSHDAFNRNERYPKVMVVHLTSVAQPGGPYDWEVSLPRGSAGLERASIAKCGEIYTLRKEQLEKRIGTVPSTTLQEIDRTLALALALTLALPR